MTKGLGSLNLPLFLLFIRFLCEGPADGTEQNSENQENGNCEEKREPGV